MNNDSQRTYKLFNLQKYFIEVKLHNPDGDILILNPEAMLQLVIEDDLHFWPTRGFFVYENPYEIIERKMSSNDEIENSQLDASTRAALKNLKPYTFRNDGKDYLDITIRPEVEEDTDLPIKKLDPKLWELHFKCVIYDKEDIEVQDITRKLKKFYFWDKDYQKMLDNHIQWSTATSTLNESKRAQGSLYVPSQATDDQRKMYTGDAIKSILLDNNFNIDENNFDRGSSKIFYSTFQDKDIWDNIDYILRHHISAKTTGQEPIDESDICIFTKNEYEQQFELIPINKLFKKAGNDVNIPLEYQLEHLFFDETGNPSNSPYKAPFLNTTDTTRDVKTTKIKKYRFVDMSTADNTQLIVTMPVHSYDYKHKTFSISMQNSNVETLDEKIKKIYIENNLLSKNGSHTLLTLNQDKIKNNKISPIFSIRANKPSVTKKGLGSLLYSSLFFNECLAFQVDGSTIRKSARFVGIDRQTNSDNVLDYKLCGQWFVTNVKHNFFHNMYTNEVIAVKMHSYDNLNISKEV
jgi:hypothetical protein